VLYTTDLHLCSTVAQVSLACLHKSGSFSNLGAHIMAGMSNCIACYEGSRDKGNDEVH
jgi:hypothetical protein